MSLAAVIKERQEKREIIRQDAVKEAIRLSSLLRNKFDFESLYIYGSILSAGFRRHSDIDMVIKGLKPELFFKAHAFLLKESDYPIDLKPFEELEESFKLKILTEGMKVG